MKVRFSVLCIFCSIFFCSFGQKETYKIEDLTAPLGLLPAASPDQLFDRIEKNFLALSVTKPLVEKDERPVISGFLQAYQEHRPVTISPDIIWLLISQGFAQHVNNNAEELRSKFVNFQGQQELTVIRTVDPEKGIKAFPWESIFPEFVDKIQEHVGPELTFALSADFTTTTPASLIASQITVMESMKKYFKYKVVMIGCGIPEVTIEGSLDDWKKILERLDYLSQFDLEWWTSELKPIIQEIINTKSGKFKRQFWMNMVRFHSEGIYGSKNDIDGWLLKFYPYLTNKTRSDLKKINSIGDLPPEIVKVPFIFVNAIDAKHPIEYKMEFWAGFFGLTQDEKTYSLKPEIGWAVNVIQNELHEENVQNDNIQEIPGTLTVRSIESNNIRKIGKEEFGQFSINQIEEGLGIIKSDTSKQSLSE